MRNTSLIGLMLLGSLLAAGRAPSAADKQEAEVVSLERAALDRWGKGDVNGFLEIYAPEITYFDAGTQRRMDGHAAMTSYLQPFTGKIKIREYEMIGPKVQRHGDVAVLTYNLRSEAVRPDGEPATIRWNSTSVYARIDRQWKVIHSHWSLTALPAAKGVM